MVRKEDLQEDYFIEKVRDQGLFFAEDLYELTIEEKILEKVPKKMAEKYHLIPVFMDKEILVLVTDSEEALMKMSLIQKELNMSIKILIADMENVKMALAKFYDVQGYHKSIDVDRSDEGQEDSPLKRKIKEMLQNAAHDRASDIHLLPFSSGVYVTFRINGHLVDVTGEYKFKPEEGINLINIIKGMDTSRSADAGRLNMPDSGSWLMYHGDTPIFVRMATVPIGNTEGLQKGNLRLLPQNHKIVKLDQIGYPADDLQEIRKVLYKYATGLFLNSGPTGAGKTTSLYAQMYDVLDFAGEPLNIMTIDDPIEIREERFTQVQVRHTEQENLDLSGSKILKIGLRSDPDMFLYNEIRDTTDAVVAIEASTTGHRVFSTVHASNCIKTITRLLDLEVSKSSLLSELRMIISQRLIGILCPHCSQDHDLTEMEKSILSEEELKKITAPGIKLRERGTVEKQKACKHCRHGFEGRIAVDEYVVFDNELRDALLGQTSFKNVENVLKSHHFKSMWEKGLDMVASGRVEFKEIVRVIGKED